MVPDGAQIGRDKLKKELLRFQAESGGNIPNSGSAELENKIVPNLQPLQPIKFLKLKPGSRD